MGTTSGFALRYPDATADNDVPVIIQRLAEDIDTVLASAASRHLAVVKRVTESVTDSTDLQNDDELFFPVAAGEKWVVDMVAIVDGSALADMQFSVAAPAGSLRTVAQNADYVSGPLTTANNTYIIARLGSGYAFTSTTNVGDHIPIHARWTIVNGANAGNITVQWAQNSARLTANSVFAGSSLTAVRVG